MADIDEEAINLPSPSQDTTHADHDLSDETKDFRFLNSLSIISDPNLQPQASIPRRGEKDFEPNPTLHQSDTLASSRNAMHNALSFPRLHYHKTEIIGIYCPDGKLSAPPVPSSKLESVTEHASPSPSPTNREETPQPRIGVGKGTCVCIPNPRGQYFRAAGTADRFNRVWLLPEEALYMLERASLDIRWPADTSKGEEEGMGGEVPMSLQAAYTCFIGRNGLTMERYVVYAGLRRGGYTVVRAESWDDNVESDDQVNGEGRESPDESRVAGREVAKKDGLGFVGFLVQLFKSICVDSTRSTARGPLIGLGIYRSYSDIYRALSLNSHHISHTTTTHISPPKTTPPFRLTYNVYKPSTSTTFRKTSPPAPDFRVAVISTRTQPTLPTLSQLNALLESTPLDPPKGEKMDRLLFVRLKHGWRNVILAVVDHGVVSFLRVADARFGGERLYEEKGMSGRTKGGKGRGGNRGGRGRGGGRGGGRGRGRL